MKREAGLDRLSQESDPWDFIVIGGGATGLGVAVDAAARGYRVMLLEQHDFAKGTSSRSTKLLHGGVRYLKQGNLSLVKSALRERSRICANAPHLARTLGFVIPAYQWHEKSFYGVGLTFYDRLAGRLSLGRSRVLSRKETTQRLPTIRKEKLRGGVLYYDGQFDDARLAVNLAQTAVEKGAVLLNYARVVGLVREGGRVAGVEFRDEETGREMTVRARCVINAGGVYCDTIRRMEGDEFRPMLVASQGTHMILPREFQPALDALMVPKTADGRVLFALPWHDRVVLGTTDIPVDGIPVEPRPREEEVEFLLEHAARYLEKAPAPEDVLSVFTGLRPLVSHGANGKKTAALSRDHTILVSRTGLITVTGGKWTTYRQMAADVLDRAEGALGWSRRRCETIGMKIHGWTDAGDDAGSLAVYGSDAGRIKTLGGENAGWQSLLHPKLPAMKAEVIWAVRHEMARTVEDILARRTRSLFLDARASMEAAPEVARMLAGELGQDHAWQRREVEGFRYLAAGYLIGGKVPDGGIEPKPAVKERP